MGEDIRKLLERCKAEGWSRDKLMQEVWLMNREKDLGIKDVRVVLNYAEMQGYIIKK